MRRQAALLVSAVVLLALPGAASGAEMPDASCPGPQNNSIGGPGGTTRFAETFTALNSGTLTSAEISVKKQGSAGDWTLEIADLDSTGKPGAVIAATTVPDASVTNTTSYGLIRGEFGSPATVNAGQQYALIVGRSASNSLQVGMVEPSTCPGSIYYHAPPFTTYGPFGATYDLVYAVFVTPPPPDTVPPQTILGKHPKHRTHRASATFTFSSDETSSSFQCRIDKKPFRRCVAPRTYRHLRPGAHVFRVASIDLAGNIDATPSKFSWRVLPPTRNGGH
jgi:hypothetical protein